jgi:hypothetical protein
MKKVLLSSIFFTLIMVVFNSVFAEGEEVIVISEEVGEVIDAEERERFGLWPEIEGFRSVRFLKLQDGSYVAEVTYEEDGLERTDRTPQSESAITSLKNYIEKVSKGEITHIEVEGKKKTVGKYTKGEMVIVSEKIGESFDEEESKKYSLFTNIPEFESASFYSIREGILIEIHTENDTLRSIVKDEGIIEILRDSIEWFGVVPKDRESFEKKWKILAYDEQGLPITETEVLDYHRVFGMTCGCALGCGSLGLLGGAVVATIQALNSMGSNLNAFPIIIGTVIGSGSGYYIGRNIDKRRMDRESIIKRIKESRKPQ